MARGGQNVEKALREAARVDAVLVRGRGWQDLLDNPRLGFDLGLTVVRRLEGLEGAATRLRANGLKSASRSGRRTPPGR